jgi:hypothetical protein
MHRQTVRGWILSAGVLLAASPAWADRIVLRGGTEIRGVVLPAEPDQPDKVLVLTKSTSNPFTFRKDQVVKVVPETDEMSGYLDHLSSVPATAEGEFELGQWCDQQGVAGPAQRHYRRALERDAEFGPAHEKLGHVYHNGRWMTQDEKKQAQGLVKRKGRWVSPQEKEALDRKEVFTAEQQNWARQVRSIRDKLFHGTEPQRQEAEDQLSAIRDPAAVQPLVKNFVDDPEPVRQRLGQVLGGIPGAEAREALVRLILAEPQLALRQVYLHELEVRHEPETVNRLIKALDAKDPVAVGHAAWALGLLQATSAVPKLISVLVKIDERMVIDEGAAAAPGYSVGFGGVVGSTSAPIAGGVGGGTLHAGGGTGHAGGATGGTGGAVGGGFGTLYPWPVLTGPVVAPGAVAFGATSVPYLSGTAMGNGGSLRPAAEVITTVYRNEEVRQALIALTGEDFGYDVPTWRHWLSTRFRAAPTTSERRVRQP